MTVLESEFVESLDDESYWDESVDDESEFLLPGIIGSALGGLFGGGRPAPRPPLPQVSVSTGSPGVSTATLNTPAGSATLRLPEAVVTRHEFTEAVRKLQDGLNRDAARANTLAKDIDTLRTRVGAVVADTQKDIARVRGDAAKHRVAVRSQIAKIKADQSQQQMMSMLMSVMAQKSLRDDLKDHRHNSSGEVTGVDSSGGSALMLLPLLMSGGSGSGSSNDFMLPLVMIMAMDKD